MHTVLFRRVAVAAVALAVAAALAAPAAAQTGGVKGKIVDSAGKPVEDAKVTIDFTGGMKRTYNTKTNKRGEFIQIGVFSGAYKVTAEKEGVGVGTADVRVRTGEPVDISITIGAAPAGAKVDPKALELKKNFEEGVAASKAGNYDEAVAKFEAAAAVLPNCQDCYYNIGFAQMQKKDYDKAEASFKKVIEIKPDHAEAYSALATLYNTQRKFDQAAEMSKKAAELAGAGGGAAAAGGGNVDAVYNQGIILWNAGKIADAKAQFEAALKINPNHAEAHYFLGMANVNEGKMTEAATEFEAYLKLAPDGPNAATAKSILGQIKK